MRCRTIVQSSLTALLSLVLIGSSLAAQGNASSLVGITVTGYGSASAPAERATVILSLSELNYGPPMGPQPGATPGANERRAVAPAVEALVAAGIDEEQIDVIVGPSVQEVATYTGPAIALLQFIVDDPSPERVSELVDAATVGAADERLIIGRAGVRYEIADCDALLREARGNALSDARERAAHQAELMEVSLGPITGSRDLPSESGFLPYTGAMPASGCAPERAAMNLFGSFNLPTFDPTASAEVVATMNVEVTFEMGPAADATPAS